MNNHFAAEFVERLTATFLKAPVLSVRPIIGKGSVNAIFQVETATQKVIIRLQRGEDARTEYRKEQWCSEQAREAGVPTPKVLTVGGEGEVAFTIQEFVPGVSGAECSDDMTLATTLGKYARIIHVLPVSGFGNILTDTTTGSFGGSGGSTWQSWVGNNLQALTVRDPLLSLGVYAEAERERIAAIFERLRERDFRFGLCHGDLSARNVIVLADGGFVLLDWGCAEVHIVPHYDFREVIRENATDSPFVRAFCQGYGLDATDFGVILQEMRWLELLKTFDLVRWAIDCKPTELPRCAADAKAQTQRTLAPR